MKPIPSMTAVQIERFWSKVDRQGEDDCWEWTASTVRGGYGQFRINGVYYLTNRVAYFIGHSEDPGDLHACHACDNPACCNPAHLWLGTLEDNNRDKVTKGRQPYGESVGHSKLTEEDVLAIRESDKTQQTLADRYGVTQVCISQVQLRKSWRHL